MNLEDIIPKLNYDNFYKFLVSLSLIAIILFSILTAQMIQLYAVSQNNTLYELSVIAYSILTVLSTGSFVWGMKKWYAMQKEIDKKRSTETKKLEAEAEKLRVEANNIELGAQNKPFLGRR